MANISVVIFDLYGTLLHLPDETKPYARLFADIGLQTPEEFNLAKRIALTEDFKDLTGLVRRIKPDAQIDIYPYQRKVEEECASAVLYPETKETLDALAKQKIRLGLISNLASPYKAPFFNLGLNVYFEKVLFSCEIGLQKPDLMIYQKMVNRFKINPSQAFMVGDNVHADVDGPKLIGMNAVLLNRNINSPTSISTLKEVIKYL